MNRILNTDSEKKEITGIVLLGIAVVLAVILHFFPPVTFELSGEDPYYTNYGSGYKDPGYELKLFGKFDLNRFVTVYEDVNVREPGEYTVRYSYRFGFETGYAERTVIVDDIDGPEISSSNPGVLTGYLGYAVDLPEYKAIDYVDGDCSYSLEHGDHDPYYYGYQYIDVHAEDTKGNHTVYIQPVVVVDSGMSMSDSLPEGIFEMRVKDGVLHMTGYIADAGNGEDMKIRLSGKNEIYGTLTQLDTHRKGYIEADFDLKGFRNGTYTLEVVQGDHVTEPEGIFISGTQRLGRLEADGKLLTWDYEDGIQVTAEDFAYQYDILIDVGHGGSDPGAIGYDGTYESDINLAVSLYEKERYEELGLRVKLLREENDYAELLGDSSWGALTKECWTFGWYSAVSKYSYSNHHNSDGTGSSRGPEVILNPYMTEETYPVPYRIAREMEEYYPVITTRWLLSTKNYNNGRRLDMSQGQTYPDVRMWYGVQRVPYEAFLTDTVTYEGAYISTESELNWYWNEENWKAVSEIKIRAYAEALGVPYTEPAEKLPEGE